MISVIAYDLKWPIQFELEAQAISNALGNNCVDIHHIGSTAVSGLSAKPIIDIIPVVLNIAKVDTQRSSLQVLDYEAKGENGMPFRRFFQKNNYNIHIFETGNPEIERQLKFRNWMQAHPEDRDQYAQLKQSLAAKYPNDIDAYCLGKDDFIANIDKKTGFNGLRVVQALTPKEWGKARHFRQHYFFDQSGRMDPYTWTFNHKDHVHFILYQGINIIGYAHLQLWQQQRAALRIFVIDEHKRNNHFGSEFLSLCERWVHSQGYTSLHIESSPAAVDFYKKNEYLSMSFDDPDNGKPDPRDVPIGKVFA